MKNLISVNEYIFKAELLNILKYYSYFIMMSYKSFFKYYYPQTCKYIYYILLKKKNIDSLNIYFFKIVKIYNIFVYIIIIIFFLYNVKKL
jgi:hypothetical protein